MGASLLACAVAGIAVLVRGEGTEPRGVRLGIPYAPGEAKGREGGRLLDRTGLLLPAAIQVTERWSDGSPRWIEVEAEAAPGIYRFEPGPSSPDPFGLRIGQGSEGIGIEGKGWAVRLPSSGDALALLEVREAGRARVTWTGAGRAPARRRLLLEAGGAFLADARVQEEREDGVGIELRLRVHRSPPLCEFELCFANGSEAPADPADAAIEIAWEGGADGTLACIRGKEVRLPEDTHPLSVFAEADGSSRLERRGVEEDRAEGILGAARGRSRLFMAVRRFRESGPVEIAADEPGRLRLALFPEEAMPPGTAAAVRGAIRFATEGMDSARALRVLERPSRAYLEPERYAAARAFGAGERGGDRRGEALERRVEGAALALLRDREIGGRHFGDFRISTRSWGNLEYDTPYGLLLAFVGTGDERLLEGAEEALFHARTVDRVRSASEPEWRGFPHRHGRDHRGPPDVGHAWVEGAVGFSRLTGDPAARAYATSVAETLALVLREGSHRDNERNAGWPLVALACLADAFPGRGFETAMEEAAASLLARYREPGLFRFETRVRRGTNDLRVSTWLQGGLLLEALGKYRLAGGKRQVAREMGGLARFLAQNALDGRRGRLHGFIEVDGETGRVIGTRGSVPPPYSMYPVAGLLRAAEATGDLSLVRVARNWVDALRPSLPDFRPRFPANGISIALRSFPFARVGRRSLSAGRPRRSTPPPRGRATPGGRLSAGSPGGGRRGPRASRRRSCLRSGGGDRRRGGDPRS